MIECKSHEDFVAALKRARELDRTTVIYVENDRYTGVPDYLSWWDVPVAEVSQMESVKNARQEWEKLREKEQYYF